MKKNKLETIMDLKHSLNTDQAIAFDQIIQYLEENPENKEAHVLKGYAGTGKTYLMTSIIKYLQWKHENKVFIAGTAPTNKAVKVLRANGSRNIVDYMTVHKLLGLRQQIYNDGTVAFKPDKEGKYDLADYDYLIIDEVSMLNDELCELLLEQTKIDKIKVIFMGDPAQIPPIGAKDCIPFLPAHEHRFRYSNLKRIMRQKEGNPIVEASMAIRDNLRADQPIDDILTKLDKETGNGIIRLRCGRDKEKLATMIKSYFLSESFTNDSDYVKIIAWTNGAVDKLNTYVRKCLFGTNLDKFMPGERLVVSSPVHKHKKKKGYTSFEIMLNTSDEIEIDRVTVQERTVGEGGEYFTGKFWILYSGKHKLQVIHKDSFYKWKTYINNLKSKAINSRKSTNWIHYYNALKYNHSVSYNYAITAHKSQGSTYDNVFLIEDDIDKNFKNLERNRIKYTSYTRSKDRLFIYKT